MKIAFIGLIKDSNIGDLILSESAVYLAKQVNPSNTYVLLDIKGRESKKSLFFFLNIHLYILKYLIHQLQKLMIKKTKLCSFDHLLFKKYLNHNLSNCNRIIFAGGGVVEYEHYDCDFFIEHILNYAKINNISVSFNAIGFNGNYNAYDNRYNKLKQMLESPIIDFVSVRENLVLAKQLFSRNDIIEICDPAVWSAEAYGVNKETEKDLIGVGLIRPDIFQEFGIEVDSDEVLKYYISVLKILESKGYRWQLFTNGYIKDYYFGLKILEEMNSDIIYPCLVCIPVNANVFLNTISKYKGIICARMHASICAYSLKIPAVAIYWNQKQKYFYDNIGCSQQCIGIGDLNAVNLLEDLIVNSYNSDIYEKYRLTIFDSLQKVL